MRPGDAVMSKESMSKFAASQPACEYHVTVVRPKRLTARVLGVSKRASAIARAPCLPG